MTERVPCTSCGAAILPETAQKNDGLCMPCKTGYRRHIDDTKRRRALEREYEKSAERKYWLQLVARVHSSDDGFQYLNAPEKTYYAVSCLVGEVYNGGFHQFFFNSAGDLYAEAVEGLAQIEAEQALSLLLHAKVLFFGDQDVPRDRRHRIGLLPDLESFDSTEIDQLEKAFWADPDKLGDRLADFADQNGLYA